jgi:hypothetical protein
MRSLKCTLAVSLIVVYASLAFAADSDVSISVEPAVPLIEHRDCQQLLNFDLTVSNHGSSNLRLTEIELSVFDSADQLVLRRTVNSDGLAPGIEIVAKPLLKAGETMDIFNPFFSFDDKVELRRLEYRFHYRVENTPAEEEKNEHRLPMDYDVETTISVSPRDYQNKTNLILPLAGRVFVWEGHDFYAHHRRVPLHAENAQKLGLHTNPNRYGSDLVIVDDQGRMYHDDPYKKENWYTYGAAVYAPGNGKIVSVANNVPDNEFEGKHIRYPELPAGSDPDLGNYVLIDHGNGEFSIFPHMMPGSVRVKAGQSVSQGDPIGRVGFSGDAIFPHVHYSLISGSDLHHAEGLPAYFTKSQRLLGSHTVKASLGALDSGDLVQSTAKYNH